MNRRRAIGLTAAGMVMGTRGLFASKRPGVTSAAHSLAFTLTPQAELFLEETQRRGCLYFQEQADPATGQVQDRARNQGLEGALDPRKLSSIAATGFGLSALCIAHQRGYAPQRALESQAERTLAFHANTLHHEHGFYCHFNDVHTGEPIAKVEYSSIDTALLLCGVLTARAYFRANPAIVRDATTIYERVDWPWMLDGGSQFRMGWKAESGFLDASWNHYCELMMIPLLAMGSPTHPVGAEVWDAWARPVMEYKGIRYISADDPLFVHQYSHAWFDFRGKHDRYTDYYANSVKATEAHRLFCLSLGAPYSPQYWGVSASDSEAGYHAWGGPPEFGDVNGTVVPCAAGGSLAFVPGACLETLQFLQQSYREKAWGRYGFCDAFHPATGWFDPDVLGIDLGIAVLMAENLRSGFMWKTFGMNPEVARGMRKAGFKPNAT